ncbi:MAG: hypothetical protein HY690_08195 [Chloroflexi bacterium]|nr:hypothetical protein [Chloroflexota bacterium]
MDERLDDHPRGRCAMVPVARTWAELGFKDVPETRVEVPKGAELFARLPPEQQRQILGPAAFAAYRAGAVKLEDFVGRKRDPHWGTMRHARSLKGILGEQEARQWRQRGLSKRATWALPRVVGGAGPPLSPHPVDRLIRDLLQTGRGSTQTEVEQIIQRLVTAPFPTSQPHLVKRLHEEQWLATTEAEYIEDLRRAIRHPTARLAIYVRRGGHIAVTLTATDEVVPPSRRGARALPELLVVYSADRGIIISGYQISSLATTGVPKNARWLR